MLDRLWEHGNLIVVKFIDSFTGSEFLPIVVSVVILLCRYPDWEFILIWLVAIGLVVF